MDFTFAALPSQTNGDEGFSCCDPHEIWRIPEEVLRGVGDLGLDPSTISKTLKHVDEGHVQRAWKGDGFLLCDGCSGYHGWFINIGSKTLLWQREGFVPKPRGPETKLFIISMRY